jgi:predicted transcriptional regulator
VSNPINWSGYDQYSIEERTEEDLVLMGVGVGHDYERAIARYARIGLQRARNSLTRLEMNGFIRIKSKTKGRTRYGITQKGRYRALQAHWEEGDEIKGRP